jgi:hypothetical protein
MPEPTLAQLIRAKHPGAYDDLDDQALEESVVAKYPGVYDDLPRTQSATRRFLSNAGEVLNPLTALQGLAQAVRHPIDTAGNIIDAQQQQFQKAGGSVRAA